MKSIEKTKMLFNYNNYNYEVLINRKNNKNKKKFMECETLEEFIAKYKMFHKQELALEDGHSYFDVETSNVDGHFWGECFDNAIRVKALNDSNPQFLSQINEEELQSEILREYKEDLKEYEDNL